jgi:hypothetical protein
MIEREDAEGVTTAEKTLTFGRRSSAAPWSLDISIEAACLKELKSDQSAADSAMLSEAGKS